LRQDYHLLEARDTLVVSIGPDSKEAYHSYWKKNELPFVGLPDEEHRVLKLYGQQVNLFKLGRQPAQMLIDKQGILRYVHYGHSMRDIPTTKEMTALLDGLQAETEK
jgi:peroxiredoxin